MTPGDSVSNQSRYMAQNESYSFETCIAAAFRASRGLDDSLKIFENWQDVIEEAFPHVTEDAIRDLYADGANRERA